MASKNDTLPAVLCFGAIFLLKREKKYTEFCKCKITGGFTRFRSKKWLRESFSQLNPQKHGAIFFNASTCENGTGRSEGVYGAIFSFFGAIFLILQMAPSSKKWTRKNCFVILSMQTLYCPCIFERGSKIKWLHFLYRNYMNIHYFA